jgi:hypothetical protein
VSAQTTQDSRVAIIQHHTHKAALEKELRECDEAARRNSVNKVTLEHVEAKKARIRDEVACH